MTKKEEKDKDNRKFLPFLLLALGVIMISGVSLAFFSDILTGDADITAGTLDLVGTGTEGAAFTFYIDADNSGAVSAGDVKLDELTIANFNPGDCVIAKASAENVGNKSAWVRSTVKLNGTTTFPEGAVTINGTDIAGEDFSSVSTDPTIINGDEDKSAAETETGITTNAYDVEAFLICFDSEATNDAQGKLANLDFKIEAVQYRNNLAQDWTDAETLEEEFGL